MSIEYLESANLNTMEKAFKEIKNTKKTIFEDLVQKVTCVEELEQIMEEIDIINYGRLITYLVFLCLTLIHQRISLEDFLKQFEKVFYVAEENNISLNPTYL